MAMKISSTVLNDANTIQTKINPGRKPPKIMEQRLKISQNPCAFMSNFTKTNGKQFVRLTVENYAPSNIFLLPSGTQIIIIKRPTEMPRHGQHRQVKIDLEMRNQH